MADPETPAPEPDDAVPAESADEASAKPGAPRRRTSVPRASTRRRTTTRARRTDAAAVPDAAGPTTDEGVEVAPAEQATVPADAQPDQTAGSEVESQGAKKKGKKGKKKSKKAANAAAKKKTKKAKKKKKK